MADNFVTTIAQERTALPKGSYKLVIEDVKFSTATDWPEWKLESALNRHNEREEARKERMAGEGKEYEVKEARTIHDLSLAEASEFVFYPRVVGGKHDGAKVRPIYTGITLNGKKEYRTKSNYYKVLDATLPDVEANIAAGSVDAREVIGYPFMAQMDVTDRGNNKYVAFIQSDDHGTRLFEPGVQVDFGAGTEVEFGAEIPF